MRRRRLKPGRSGQALGRPISWVIAETVSSWIDNGLMASRPRIPFSKFAGLRTRVADCFLLLKSLPQPCLLGMLHSRSQGRARYRNQEETPFLKVNMFGLAFDAFVKQGQNECKIACLSGGVTGEHCHWLDHRAAHVAYCDGGLACMPTAADDPTRRPQCLTMLIVRSFP